jgi:hypothetical protein
MTRKTLEIVPFGQFIINNTCFGPAKRKCLYPLDPFLVPYMPAVVLWETTGLRLGTNARMYGYHKYVHTKL